MKLSSIIRRSLPFNPSRAGIPPTWDRPDPPTTQKSPRTRRLTTEEKHFTFFDAATPSYMLVNSEVAEGDLGEAFPSFVKNLSLLLLTGATVGFLGFIWSTRNSLWLPHNFNVQADRLENEKSSSEGKYGLKDLQNNPWKLNVWPESFPIRNLGIQDKAYNFQKRSQSLETLRKINKQALAYWTRLQGEVEQSLKSGASSGHH